MGATPRKLDPQGGLVSTYRDLARERWRARMSWSMMAATAAHASMFAFWSTGDRPDPPPDLAMDVDQPVFVSFYDIPVRSDLPPGTLPVRQVSSSAVAEPDVEPRPGLTQEDLADLAEELSNRLVRGASIDPTISDLQFEGADEAPTDDTTAVGGADGTGRTYSDDLASLRGLSALDLERLSALRPDVALEASSNWVLVRNPVEVSNYMRRSSTEEDRGPEIVGTVSVALWVSASGSVEWAEIIGSSGRSDLDDIALTLFSDVVTFRPARLEGAPMPMSAIFTINFPW